MIKGTVFDIQRFSLHDGPGIRTTVFLKGCTLHCFWCHNPEGIGIKKQIQFLESRCIHCGACVTICPEGAQEMTDGSRNYNRDLCKTCGKCIETCFVEALSMVGKQVNVNEIMQEVLPDRPFYDASGGGVTLSGGEPAMQIDFSVAILKACNEAGIHSAIETAGNIPLSYLKRLATLSDLVMMDIKHMDEHKHRRVTGVSNKLILENARHLIFENKPILFRTPLIPSVNDNHEDITAIGEFLAGLLREIQRDNTEHPGITWELLTFHKLASDKYRGLGIEYQASDLDVISKEKIKDLIHTAEASGLQIKFSI